MSYAKTSGRPEPSGAKTSRNTGWSGSAQVRQSGPASFRRLQGGHDVDTADRQPPDLRTGPASLRPDDPVTVDRRAMVGAGGDHQPDAGRPDTPAVREEPPAPRRHSLLV